MSNGGDALMKSALQAGADATKNSSDPRDKALYAICLALLDQANKSSSWIKCGPVEASGFSAMVIAVGWLVLKVYGVLP